MNKSKDTIVVIIAIIILIPLVFWAGQAMMKRVEADKLFLSELERVNLQVLSCDVHSPPVTVRIETPAVFISLAISQGQDTVYGYNGEYYVFNQDLTMAWVYNAEWKDFMRDN